MTDTIREVAARALWQHDLGLGGVSFTLDQREEYLESVDPIIAAIEQMIREPLEAQIKELQARCERVVGVAQVAEFLVAIEWNLHRDGMVDMGETHTIEQLDLALKDLQPGDLDLLEVTP